VEQEVPALDEHVDRRDHAGRRRADHGRVVTDADRSQRARGHPRPERRDDPPFAQVRDGPVIASDLAASTCRAIFGPKPSDAAQAKVLMSHRVALRDGAVTPQTPQITLISQKTTDRDETGLDHCCTVTPNSPYLDKPDPSDLMTKRQEWEGFVRAAIAGRSQEDAMVQAYILVQTEVGKAADVARQIAQIDGVTQAEDVTGPYDVIVRARAENVDELGKLVAAKIQAVQGITRTLTCPVVHI
jgi:DNA-binding Lrp family transcriptional regulator